ncbi:MAG: hypothetical protein ACK4OK_04145 [Thermoflexus sp.]
MEDRSRRLVQRSILLIAAIGLGIAAGSSVEPRPARAQSVPHIGYGVNPWNAADPGIGDLGFDWTKVFGSPGGRLPYRTLRRVDAHASTLNNLSAWGDWLENEAQAQAAWIEAWEIGNEPNLDAPYGWAAPPNAADYTRVLCEAYRRIKRADPTAIVVSGGLAPTGRVPFTWNGHKGYCAPGLEWCPGYYQDEREFLREMLQAGAANCFDALGFHPYGFAAPATAAPGSPECGPNDFCFRTVEVIRQIMVNEFGVDKPIWATEFGWLVDPRQVGRPECWNDPSFSGRQWQVVSPDQQATYLVQAYQWADANWPWMGAMLVFNYGFSEAPSNSLPPCDQMRFYDIKGRPAEQALRGMIKNKVPARPLWNTPVTLLSDVDTPLPLRGAFRLRSSTPDPLSWTVLGISAPFPVTLDANSGTDMQPLSFSVDPSGKGLGVYTGTIQVQATVPSPLSQSVSVENPNQELQVVLRVVPEVYRTMLPLVLRR